MGEMPKVRFATDLHDIGCRSDMLWPHAARNHDDRVSRVGAVDDWRRHIAHGGSMTDSFFALTDDQMSEGQRATAENMRTLTEAEDAPVKYENTLEAHLRVALSLLQTMPPSHESEAHWTHIGRATARIEMAMDCAGITP
jgi:hypothetical protein